VDFRKKCCGSVHSSANKVCKRECCEHQRAGKREKRGARLQEGYIGPIGPNGSIGMPIMRASGKHQYPDDSVPCNEDDC